MKTYSFHLTFSDGSRPVYHYPCGRFRHNSELRKWRKLYRLKLITHSGNCDYYQAVRIVPTPQLNLYM